MVKEHILRNHAGWSITSKMPQRYIHYFGSESSKSILKVKGIIKENESGTQYTLKSIQCPNCSESNKQESPFCVKRKMVLSYESYNEVRNIDKQKMDRLESDVESLKNGMTLLAKNTSSRLTAVAMASPINSSAFPFPYISAVSM